MTDTSKQEPFDAVPPKLNLRKRIATNAKIPTEEEGGDARPIIPQPLPPGAAKLQIPGEAEPGVSSETPEKPKPTAKDAAPASAPQPEAASARKPPMTIAPKPMATPVATIITRRKAAHNAAAQPAETPAPADGKKAADSTARKPSDGAGAPQPVPTLPAKPDVAQKKPTIWVAPIAASSPPATPSAGLSPKPAKIAEPTESSKTIPIDLSQTSVLFSTAHGSTQNIEVKPASFKTDKATPPATQPLRVSDSALVPDIEKSQSQLIVSKTQPISIGPDGAMQRTQPLSSAGTQPIAVGVDKGGIDVRRTQPLSLSDTSLTPDDAKGQAQSGRPRDGTAESDMRAAASKTIPIDLADASKTMPLDLSAISPEELGQTRAKPQVPHSDVAKSSSSSTQPLAAQTIHMRIPPPSGAGSGKRATSKVPLSAATQPLATPAGTPPPPIPETIRVKPVAPVADDASVGAGNAIKIQTSRIPLEEAFGGVAAGRGAGAAKPLVTSPQTIRLKKVPGGVETGRGAEAQLTNKTAHMDIPAGKSEGDAAKEDASAPTRRKTIKVRRPGAPAAVPSLSIARPTADATPTTIPGVAPEALRQTLPSGVTMEPVLSTAADKVNPVFPILAAVATLIVCVTIYLFMTQVFGPNASGTQLSYGMPGLDLPWPGKMVRDP